MTAVTAPVAANSSTIPMRPPEPEIAGWRVLVTGASQGIGAAIAEAFARGGAEVHVAGRRPDRLRDVTENFSPPARVHALDLAKRDSIDALGRELGGNLDVLVNCGGMYGAGTMQDATPGSLDTIMACNVLGPYELTRQLLPGIVARRGQIVFINSSIVRGGGPHTGQFAATAHALRAIADSLRAEVNPLGVRVLSVFPGRTATPRQAAIFAREGRAYHPERLLQPEDIAATIVHSLSLPASAELTDVWIRPARNFAPRDQSGDAPA